MSRSKELILLGQRIRALSQTGLVYSLSEYDTERYEELSRLSDEITALATGLKPEDVYKRQVLCLGYRLWHSQG